MALMPAGEEALRQLLEGHQRYLSGQPLHQHQDRGWRATLAYSQHPFALVLGCADSRVSPEIIFDQGLGDLFTIRTAGHVLDNAVLGTVEYGLEELNIPLVMVMGHERCGAVQGAVKAVDSGNAIPGHLGALLAAITPAVKQVKDQPGDILDNVVRAHVRLTMRQLQTDVPLLAQRIREKLVTIVGVRTDLDTGDIELLA
jgi:carbonic anhydrase